MFFTALMLSILIVGSIVGLVVSAFYTVASFISLFSNIKDELTGNVEKIYK